MAFEGKRGQFSLQLQRSRVLFLEAAILYQRAAEICILSSQDVEESRCNRINIVAPSSGSSFSGTGFPPLYSERVEMEDKMTLGQLGATDLI